MSANISIPNGIVIAIDVQVESVGLQERIVEYAHIIRRDEPARFGVVVTTVQVVEPRLFVVVVPTVAERVDREQFRTALRKDLTPRVVLVFPEQIPAMIADRYDVPLQVLAVIVLLSVVLKSRHARVIVIVMDDRAPALFREDLIAFDEVLRRALRLSDALIVIRERRSDESDRLG